MVEASCDYQILVRLIDDSLLELGITGIVDARKARDQLLDLRSLCLTLELDHLEPVP